MRRQVPPLVISFYSSGRAGWCPADTCGPDGEVPAVHGEVQEGESREGRGRAPLSACPPYLVVLCQWVPGSCAHTSCQGQQRPQGSLPRALRRCPCPAVPQACGVRAAQSTTVNSSGTAQGIAQVCPCPHMSPLAQAWGASVSSFSSRPLSPVCLLAPWHQRGSMHV